MRRFLLAGVAALALTGCTAFEDGPATVPGSALARVAERLAANGDATTAATLYRSAIAMGNGSAEVRRGYGNALLALGQPQAAIEQYEAALTQVKDARLYNGIGVALDMLGDHARAQERFREGLALAPDNKGLIHNYGLSLAAEAEKGPAATAEAAPGEPDESAPAKVALQPVPQDEPTPVLRPPLCRPSSRR
jgi:Flp pilus assembly protein TadD